MGTAAPEFNCCTCALHGQMSNAVISFGSSGAGNAVEMRIVLSLTLVQAVVAENQCQLYSRARMGQL
jgi:hypothetical protein